MTLSEKQKMLAGELYRSTDPELQADARADRERHARQVTLQLRLRLTHPHW